MELPFYEAKEEEFAICDTLMLKDKYGLDAYGRYRRESYSLALALRPLSLSEEEKQRILAEANAYEIWENDVEYGDHDDMGEFGVDSSSRTVFLWDRLVHGILVKDGHFYGVYVANSGLVIDGFTYGRCLYPITPTREDTNRTNYYRNLDYELIKK